MVNVAVMGHGVVGSGVAEVLLNNRDVITKNAKAEINIKHILDLRDFEGLSYSNKFTKNFEDIVNDSEVQIVAEAMGGLEPAYTFVKRCLEAGKSVVTSNKELVAAKGAELLKIARDKNVNFLFEASVGGGIPILRPLSQCLAANKITEIFGILNGTTNFILTKMICDNFSFEDALKLAQDLGYAERIPDADVLGHDACRKICILASIAFGRHVYPEYVSTNGITEITLEDVEYADKLGYVIKLITHAKDLENGKIAATVYPALVCKDNMLAGVRDVYNAVTVCGNAVDDTFFYGKGAGKLPTASAVVADIIDCAKHLEARKYLFWEDSSESFVEAKENLVTRLYIKLKNTDNTAVYKIKALFGDVQLINNTVANETVFITAEGVEKELIKKLDELKAYTVDAVLNVI